MAPEVPGLTFTDLLPLTCCVGFRALDYYLGKLGVGWEKSFNCNLIVSHPFVGDNWFSLFRANKFICRPLIVAKVSRSWRRRESTLHFLINVGSLIYQILELRSKRRYFRLNHWRHSRRACPWHIFRHEALFLITFVILFNTEIKFMFFYYYYLRWVNDLNFHFTILLIRFWRSFEVVV